MIAAVETQARISLDLAVNDLGGDQPPDLSEADLFFSSRATPGENDHTVLTGWNINEALSYAQQAGIVPESCFPYSLEDILNERGHRCAEAHTNLTSITGHVQLDQSDAIKRWLATRGPLVACLTVHFDFMFYHSGIYTKSAGPLNATAGGHGVCCIGYDDVKQAWLCKNSWGTFWGEAGFFWIGYGECDIDTRMWGIDGFSAIAIEAKTNHANAPGALTLTSAFANDGGVL